MKKSIHKVTVMLLTCTLFGSPMFWLNTPAAHAEATASVNAPISKEQAVQTARALANLPESTWTLVNSEYRTSAKDNWGNTLSPRWQLDFSDNAGRLYSASNVVIDGITGKLISLNRYGKEPGKDNSSSQEQAQKIAEDFIKTVAPNQFKETELTSSTVDGIGSPYKFYNFIYERKTADGVFVLGDQIVVTVHGDGTLTSYTCNWTNANLPKADPKVSISNATKTYRDALDLNLNYQFSYKTSTPTANLVYSTLLLQNSVFLPNAPSLMVDAQSGNVLDRYGNPTTPTKLSIAPLDPKGPTEPTKRPNTLTQDEAESLLRSSGLLSATTVLGEASYSDNGSKMWSFSILDKATQSNSGTVALDATTGELLNYNMHNKSDPSSSSSAIVSFETLKAKSIDLVKKLYPGRTGSLAYLGANSIGDNVKDPSSNDKSVTFAYLKNGIPSPNNLQIMFDAQGNVINFYGNSYYSNPLENNASYPDPSRAVTLDKAKDTYIKNRPTRLSYYFPMLTNGTRSTTPVLVYAPSPSENERWNNYVDALTGEWISLDPGAQPPSTPPSDIIGHWAEKALTQFANLGLLELQDGKVHPDRQISRGEFIHLLANIRGGISPYQQRTFQDVPTDSKYFNDIENAVERGWIAKDTQFHPDDTITRQEVATILTRVLGHQELAKHNELFVLPYADAVEVAPWAKGSVAILNGLGVMMGADDRFLPGGNVTLAESCTALLKVQTYDYPMNK